MLNAVREPYAGKVARTVLRGPRFREGARLPSKRSSVRLNIFQQTRATKFEKRFMNVDPTFEANTKTTGVVKPRMCTFDNPAEFAQTTAVPCPAFGYHWFDVALAKFLGDAPWSRSRGMRR
jgi:hypothetical protein